MTKKETVMSNGKIGEKLHSSLWNQYLNAIESCQSPCLTLLLPTPNGGKDWAVHQKRIRNEINELSKNDALKKKHGPQFDELLERAERLIRHEEKWGGDYRGVCLHVSPDFADLHRLKEPVDEFWHVGERFLMKPLSGHFAAQFDGLVLRLSMKNPSLHRVKGDRAKLLAEDALPKSIYDFSEQDVVDGGQQAHVRQTQKEGGPWLSAQGMESKESTRELNLEPFLRQITRVIEGLHGSESLPLLVIGDPKVSAAFERMHQRTGDLHIIDQKTPPRMKESELLKICNEWARRDFEKAEAAFVERIRSADPTSERFSDNLREVFQESRNGRVERCLVASDSRIWCLYDEGKGSLDTVKNDVNVGDGEVFEALDAIFANTLSTGGDCLAVPSDIVPGDKPVAAIYKW